MITSNDVKHMDSMKKDGATYVAIAKQFKVSAELVIAILAQYRDDHTYLFFDTTSVGTKLLLTKIMFDVEEKRHIPHDETSGLPFLFLEGCEVWDGATHAKVMKGEMKCPVCKGAPACSNHYCSYCDKAGFDNQQWWRNKGVDVGLKLNDGWDYSDKPTSYKKGALRGGL
jgi:hypothetical protein